MNQSVSGRHMYVINANNNYLSNKKKKSGEKVIRVAPQGIFLFYLPILTQVSMLYDTNIIIKILIYNQLE